MNLILTLSDLMRQALDECAPVKKFKINTPPTSILRLNVTSEWSLVAFNIANHCSIIRIDMIQYRSSK